MKKEDIRNLVRREYGKIAANDRCGCGCGPSCCGPAESAETLSRKMGYSEDDMLDVPDGANLGLGCGNPVAIASLCEGETVLDLGSGAGFDSFLAASRVGRTGRIIGVDMTAEMIEKARRNAEKGNYRNVEFRLGEIEHLPLADNSVDVIISNCVINLSPDKPQVFAEAFRVLRPGGRIMVSDIVVTQHLPEFVRESESGYIGCVAGALLREDYLEYIRAAGFTDITIMDEFVYPIEFIISDPIIQEIMAELTLDDEKLREMKESVLSIKIRAKKS